MRNSLDSDENLFRLIFEIQIHTQIHICYSKSLPIATYYLTTIHIKNLYLHSKTYHMKFISDVTFPSWPGKSVNSNFRQQQSYGNNDKFNCWLETQPKSAAKISTCTLNTLKLPSNQINISCQFPVVTR